MLRTAAIAAGALGLMAGPAFAASCPKHMKEIDEALAKNPSASAEQIAKAKALRAEGEAQHKAGKHAESVKSLTDAKKQLGM